MTLYAAMNNNAIVSIDALGQLSFSDVLGLTARVLAGLASGSSFSATALSILQNGNANGVAAEVSMVSGVGFQVGLNTMFFPETCEVARYWYAVGGIASAISNAAPPFEPGNPLVVVLRNMAIGVDLATASVAEVTARPVLRPPHDANSWRGWSYTWAAGVSIPGTPVAVGVSAFANAQWVGGSVGGGLTMPLPVITGSYARLWFDYVDSRSVKDLSQYTCLCTGLRILNMDPDRGQSIVRAVAVAAAALP